MQRCPYCAAELNAQVFFQEKQGELLYDCSETICLNRKCSAYGEVVASQRTAIALRKRRKQNG